MAPRSERNGAHDKRTGRVRGMTLVLVLLLLASAVLVQQILQEPAPAARLRDAAVEDEPEETAETPPSPHVRGALAGVVVGPDGRLLAGATVRWRDEGGTTATCAPAATGADGDFRCPDVPLPGRLTASAPGLATPPPALAARVPRPRTDLRLRLRASVRLSGRVLDGLRPAHGAELHVHLLAPESLDGVPLPPTLAPVRAHSDAAGAFAFEAVWPGRMRVEARLPDRAPAYSEPFSLDDGQRRDGLQIVLGPGGTLSGTVRARGGAPLAGAIVELDGVVGGPVGRADAQGAFRMDAVPRGAWRFVARAPGYRDAVADLEILDHAAPSVLFELEPLPGLGGRVVDTDGRPVLGARVDLDAAGRHVHARTDADGRFRFDQVPSGQGGRAVASHDEHADSAEVELLPGAAPTLRLGAPGFVEGSVVDADGRAVGPAVVRIADEHHDGPGEARPHRQRVPTDEHGRFRLGPLRPGRFDLSATLDDHPPALRRGVRVGGGETLRGVTLTLDGGATLQGRVQTTDGPAASVALALRCGEEPERTGTSDGEGQYRFDGLPPGVCWLSARAPGHLVEVGTITIGDHGAHRLDLRLRDAGEAREAALPRHGFDLRESEDGMVVARVRPGSPAAAAGLDPGDRVRSVDFRPLGAHDFAGVVGEAAQGSANLTLEIVRDSRVETVYVPAESESP